MKSIQLLSGLVLSGALLTACGGYADNTPPTVSLAASTSSVTMVGDVTLTATASDESGIKEVRFYQGSTLIATDTTAPYTTTTRVNQANNGTLNFTATALDNAGHEASASTSVGVNITDVNEPNNSVTNATPLVLGTAQKASVYGTARDYDYYSFTATAGQMLKLNVTSKSTDAASTLDPYVMILMPDGKTILEKDDDSGAGLESEIRFNAPVAGTYTAVVTSFDIYDDKTGTVGDDKITNTYQILLSQR
ncbi:Ig-like domain-containing protein [Deinococcus hohokamensis]|uniref:Ig-like domain-containing protein n=1 Tax=Deinococcus hohokamensis TaxID=309883 RepID=A0ABV9IA20_9DEIO